MTIADVSPASAADEELVVVPAGADDLFAIVTTPPAESSGVGAIVLSGGPKGTASIGRNRLYVRLCRTLADAGVVAVRFDYHGTGESTGELEAGISLRTPFSDDVRAMAEVLRSRGIERIVLVGTCFGSRTALAAAPHAPGLAGIALISPPLRDMRLGEAKATRVATTLNRKQLLRRALRRKVFEGLFDARRRREYIRILRVRLRTGFQHRRAGSAAGVGPAWLNDDLVRQVEWVADRRLPMLIVYGDSELFYEEFNEARAGRLGPALDYDGVEVETIPGTLHGFTTLAAQDGTITAVDGWLQRRRADVLARGSHGR